jgi:hypothetical protein
MNRTLESFERGSSDHPLLEATIGRRFEEAVVVVACWERSFQRSTCDFSPGQPLSIPTAKGVINHRWSSRSLASWRSGFSAPSVNQP